MGPKECICSFRCCVNLEEWLLFRKARLYSLYLFIRSFMFVLCMLSCNQGRLVYRLLMIRIFQSSELCVLGSFVWCYLYGKVFLCLSVWIYWWYMWFLYLSMWMWSIYVWVLEDFCFLFCLRLGGFVDGFGRNYYRGYYRWSFLLCGILRRVTGVCLVCCIGI